MSLFEVSGVIKQFDRCKGYGFIAPDGGRPNIFLHITCLERYGFSTAYEGARIVCEVVQKPEGLCCRRILSMDESTSSKGKGRVKKIPPPRAHAKVFPVSGFKPAECKSFSPFRGFGFLTRGQGTPDIFVHITTLKRHGIGNLQPGQTVLVRYGKGPDGLVALEVESHRGIRKPRQ